MIEYNNIFWMALAFYLISQASVLFMAVLYHRAHGRKSDAVELGARIVLDSWARQGVVAPDGMPVETTAINLGDEDDWPDIKYESPLPDVIKDRSERFSNQMGDEFNAFDDVLAEMDKKQGVKDEA